MAPVAVLSDPVDSSDEYQPRFLAINGRIGRLRYLLYSFVSTWVLMMVIGILAAILLPMLGRGGGNAGLVMMGVIYIPVLALTFIMAKRRLNDLDRSGWYGLLFLVPILNLLLGLYLMFGRGSEGSNRYGPKPAKNPGAILFVVLAVIAVFVIGILAAIAIPQYKLYSDRAKARAAQTRSAQ